ncbi:hypothetical protein CRYUN_Cryun11dG0150600 [Craigia yunnanensis]
MFHTMKGRYKNSEMDRLDSSRFSFSPSMEPSSSQPPTELVFSHDRHFALHGEIWLLVVVFVFALFLAFILFLLRLRRGRSPESEVSGSNNIPQRRNCPVMSSRKRRDRRG